MDVFHVRGLTFNPVHGELIIGWPAAMGNTATLSSEFIGSVYVSPIHFIEAYGADAKDEVGPWYDVGGIWLEENLIDHNFLFRYLR